MKEISEKRLKILDNKFWKEAAELKLTEDRRFVDAAKAYEFQRELSEGLRVAIDEEGYKIEVPVGRDATKMVSNPSIADLNKAEILAQKLRQELDSKLEKARAAKPPEARPKL